MARTSGPGAGRTIRCFFLHFFFFAAAAERLCFLHFFGRDRMPRSSGTGAAH